MMYGEFGVGVALPERFTGEVDSREDASRFGEDDSPRSSIACHGSRRRDVAAADVLSQRAANQITVGVGGQRLEGNAHARGSGTGSTAKVS
jgi:hypothetical protein